MSENKNSFYDPGLIVKEVHDFYGQSLRVRDTNALNSQHFTHFSASYDVNNNPTQISYFRGTESHITNIGCVADVAGSLNNKYFTLRACPSNALYHVWFNVDGTGTAPVVANSTPIEVQISANDPAIVVATAIRLTINNLFSSVFKATQAGATLEIRTVGLGVCSNSLDVNTGFVIANTQGQQVTTDTVNITYSGTDPIYNGQVLKNYKYDIWNGSFNYVEADTSGKLIPVAFDDFEVLTKTDDGPTSVRYNSGGNQVALLTITYDVDGDIVKVTRS